MEICQRVAAGDEDARRELMELLFDRIHKTASYLTGSPEEAEDVAQAACMEVLASAGSFRGNSTLQYWADRVTLFTASKIVSTRTRRQGILDKYFHPAEPMPGVDEQADYPEIQQRLALHLRKVKYAQREVLLLRYVHGYTINEAAKLCGIPLETARGRLKKGRATLKKKVMADPLLREWVQEWVLK
ncbi:MAG: RNA polymerase sigma factor [Deltaproteobacteria bacterium]|nr:RNA polymerase sigma factor [Deltaproteobacteria bacterium]